MELLFKNSESDGDYVTLPIPTDDLSLLFDSGIFDSINNELSMFIDDTEEEEIVDIEKIHKLCVLIDKYDAANPIVDYYTKLLRDLCELAIKFNTGVFFYF